MFQISYSKWLRWEVNIWASKNASLPIVAANFLLDEPVNLTNKPDILDLQVLKGEIKGLFWFNNGKSDKNKNINIAYPILIM